MGNWKPLVAGVALMLGLATPVTAAPPAAPTTTTLTRGALTIHPLGASGDSWSAFNAAGAGLVRVRTLANLVDAIMTIQCRGAGLAGDLYLLPCLPGDIATMSYGGALNDLRLSVTAANGVNTQWPEGTLFSLVITADNVELPASLDAAPVTATGPFTLTLVTPDGQLYTGAGTFAATFVADASDPTRWNVSQVVYTLRPPAAATPFPHRPPRH